MSADRRLFTWNRRRRRWLWLASWTATLAAVAWLSGLLWFAGEVLGDEPAEERVTDAIVVLTGGSGRLEAGLALLANGKAEKLFVSGVYHGVDVAALLRLSHEAPQELDCCIVLGYSADDTRGNAVETATWVAEEGYQSVRLVTANYHMPRSLLEFRRSMPAIDVVPHPVKPSNVVIERWWRSARGARLMLTEYSKYLVALTLGWPRGAR
ncbi:MAG: YdcF family protein [Alphaproteobacteria bacterium]